jgi:hypothetical protein
VTCADYERHELLVTACRHQAGPQVQVEMDDGCSGRLCQDCVTRLDVKRWPGLADRIAGPAAGLDVLQMARALAGQEEAVSRPVREGRNCCPRCGSAALALTPRPGGGWDAGCANCGDEFLPLEPLVLSMIRPPGWPR